MIPLGDLISEAAYGTSSRANENSEGIPILRMNNITKNGRIDLSSLKHIVLDTKDIEKYRVKNGDLLFNRTNSRELVGKTAVWNHGDGYVIAGYLIRVRFKEGVADPSYISHVLNSFWGKTLLYTRAKTSGNMCNLSLTDFKRLKIPLPSIEEQKRIAGILDAADALRVKRREAIANLDALLQSTFLTLFGDPVTNPMDWRCSSIGEVLKLKSGNGLVAKDMAVAGKYPVYGGNGITGYHDAYMFEEPKITIGRVGVYCGSVHLTKPNAWITDNALYVDKILEPIDQTYLVSALKIANLNQYAGQAAQPLVSGSRIYPVLILRPPLKIQKSFAVIVEAIKKQKAQQYTYLAELDALFASLQFRAFKGEL